MRDKLFFTNRLFVSLAAFSGLPVSPILGAILPKVFGVSRITSFRGVFLG